VSGSLHGQAALPRGHNHRYPLERIFILSGILIKLGEFFRLLRVKRVSRCKNGTGIRIYLIIVLLKINILVKYLSFQSRPINFTTSHCCVKQLTAGSRALIEKLGWM
jgi:hypothetical protein